MRRFSSADEPEKPLEGQNVPAYWPRPPQVLSAKAGLHRFVWDLHYPRPAVLRFGYPISATPRNTPFEPFGPWVLPGRYTVRLTAGGQSQTETLVVKMDPRVETSPAAIAAQFEHSMTLYRLLRLDFDALAEVRAFRADPSRAAMDREAAAIERSLTRLNGELGSLFGIVERADVLPASQVVEAMADRARALEEVLSRWQKLKA